MLTFIFYVAAATFWASQNGHARPAFTQASRRHLLPWRSSVGFGVFPVYIIIRDAIQKGLKK